MTRPRPWEALDSLPVYVAMRERSYQFLTARPPGPIVDVGCGSGRALRELAARSAEVIGVDPDAVNRDEAQRLSPHLDVRAGTAERLPFPAASLAGYRAERLFHLFGDPVVALAEARRVLLPQAPLVLLTQDWAMVTSDDTSPIAQRVLRAASRAVPAPFAGRRSRAAVLAAGFTEVTVEVVTAVLTGQECVEALAPILRSALTSGGVDPGDAERWLDEKRASARTDHGLLAIPTFVVTARTPSVGAGSSGE